MSAFGPRGSRHRANPGLRRSIESVIRGKTEAIEHTLVTLLARGHLLIEDVPGVGKTTLAQALARSLDASFRRIQFTSDLLPSDIVGVSVFHRRRRSSSSSPARSSRTSCSPTRSTERRPKTQSAMLEAMNEAQVSIDSHSTRCRSRSSSSRPRTRSSIRAPIRSPSRSSTGSSCGVRMGYPSEEAEKACFSKRSKFSIRSTRSSR